MATESPMRMVEGSQASKWLSSEGASAFGSSFESKAMEDLVLFLEGQKLAQDKAGFVPSRSGSAPPCMEGSVAAVGNVLAAKGSRGAGSNSDSLGNAMENRKSEGQCLFDPYAAYRVSNDSLNPGLPPRNLSSETGSCKENQGPDKKGSVEEASRNLFEDSRIHKPGQNASLLSNNHKSLVDLIQQDFPRTPSPVYSQSHLLSRTTTEGAFDLDVHAFPSSVSSVHVSNLPDSSTNSASAIEKDSLNLDSCDLIPNDGAPSETFRNMHHSDGNKSPSEDQTCSKGAGLKDDVSTYEFIHTEKQKLGTYTAEARRHKQKENKPNQSFANGFGYQIPGAGEKVVPQGMNYSQNYFGEVAHGHTQFSSLGIQPSISSLGLAGSGGPFYPTFQPSGLFAPQYSSEGYAVSSSIFPPYMAGYSSHGTSSLPFDIAYGPNLKNGQATTVSSGERVPHTGDFQNQSEFYGQHGLTLQPSYVDPSMQYYHHYFHDTYPAALRQNQLPPRLTGSQFNSQASQQTSDANACLYSRNYPPSINGGLTIPSVRNTCMDATMQLPALSLGSPILPSSPMGGTSPLGGPNEKTIPLVSPESARFCSGQRGFRSYGDPKKQSVIEELKSTHSGKFELSDIAGCIVEFSIDQHGSRFIQQKLESCSAEERTSVFEEILPHASQLMTDVFGNYVIQKFFEHGSPDQRKKLAEQLSGHMLSLSMQMYGCRVIQKVLEVIELDQKVQLVRELDGHVMRCVHDQNGNHVIQKCIECIPMEKVPFILSAFQGQVRTLSTHPYGCRVIQRVLEHCSDEQNIRCIVDEILESAFVLAQDQYGNYVTQHALERGTPRERSQIISKLTGKIVQLSQHKYASNVVEKCWEHGGEIEREALIEEIVQQPSESGNLLTMMKDQFANYVVQKILERCSQKHREILLSHIRVHLHVLKKYTYGKHIVARFEQLAGPGNEAEEV